MTVITFGIDFGTTNSLAARVDKGRALPLVDRESGQPHPSVVWYSGDEIIVGREAKEHLDLSGGGAPPGFLRSPKMKLRREGPIYVEGREVAPVDAVAEVLRHVKADALLPREGVVPPPLTTAVLTIPVDFGGPQRRALREAARAAGIGVVQFVHEPVAALYAYLRSRPDYLRRMTELEGRSILVFDWGGGTLDLTLCRIQGGSIMQVANDGDNEVGGDEFDARLMNLLRERHAARHGLHDVRGMEQPGMGAKLRAQCETVKIGVSKEDAKDVIIRNYLRADGQAANLIATVTRAEVDATCASLVARGLARVDDLLARARMTYRDVELCLATGGMVNMPAIADGLYERFVGRVADIDNGDRIIAESAAWIAHDALRLRLAKPIEILVADSSGRGSYHQLLKAGIALPVENSTYVHPNTRLYCVDPREGIATIELAKPEKVGLVMPNDPRTLLCSAEVAVDPMAAPLLERIECHLRIDHDYVVNVLLRSTGRGDETEREFHDIEFALSMPLPGDRDDDGSAGTGSGTGRQGTSPIRTERTNVTQRTNVAVDDGSRTKEEMWRLVPGDLVTRWRPEHFAIEAGAYSTRQRSERGFYQRCSLCGRTSTQISMDPPTAQCQRHICGRSLDDSGPSSGVAA